MADRPRDPIRPGTASDPRGSRRLRIGVLICDHLDPAILERHADYGPRYRELLAPPGDPEGPGAEASFDVVELDLTAGELPDDPAACDAWLVGGSRLDAHGDGGFVPGLVEFVARVLSENVPLVGICFGHQILARALGGRIERAGSWGAGVKRFSVLGSAPWITVPSDPVSLVVSHRDQVADLPPGAELVLTAAYCPVAGFRVGERAFAVQAHPEFDTGLSRTLSEGRREIMGDDVTADALASLDLPTDSGQVNRWIRRFLLHATRARES